jgi:hypothetical protein
MHDSSDGKVAKTSSIICFRSVATQLINPSSQGRNSAPTIYVAVGGFDAFGRYALGPHQVSFNTQCWAQVYPGST